MDDLPRACRIDPVYAEPYTEEDGELLQASCEVQQEQGIPFYTLAARPYRSTIRNIIGPELFRYLDEPFKRTHNVCATVVPPPPPTPTQEQKETFRKVMEYISMRPPIHGQPLAYFTSETMDEDTEVIQRMLKESGIHTNFQKIFIPTRRTLIVVVYKAHPDAFTPSLTMEELSFFGII